MIRGKQGRGGPPLIPPPFPPLPPLLSVDALEQTAVHCGSLLPRIPFVGLLLGAPLVRVSTKIMPIAVRLVSLPVMQLVAALLPLLPVPGLPLGKGFLEAFGSQEQAQIAWNDPLLAKGHVTVGSMASILEAVMVNTRSLDQICQVTKPCNLQCKAVCPARRVCPALTQRRLPGNASDGTCDSCSQCSCWSATGTTV